MQSVIESLGNSGLSEPSGGMDDPLSASTSIQALRI
jgi:hypothetical protein